MAYRQRVKGSAAVRRLLQRAPEEAKEGLVTELHRSGAEMLRRMLGNAPVRTGKLRRGLSYKVYPKTLKLQVGLIGTKKQRSKLFYARIQDLGRKAQIVTARRFRSGGQKIFFRGSKFGPSVQTYAMHVPAMPGKHFVTGKMADLRRILQANLKGLWNKALRRVSRSGSE